VTATSGGTLRISILPFQRPHRLYQCIRISETAGLRDHRIWVPPDQSANGHPALDLPFQPDARCPEAPGDGDRRGPAGQHQRVEGPFRGEPGGSIVCLSSISGLAGQKDQSTYGPAKFVASGITKHLAVEWADRGIRVNAVAPGTIQTEAVAALPEDYKAPMKEAHPIGRLGEPSEVANAILFLASDEASFVTGAILPVDGGYLAR
jgi:NAD(P)-dependent dehydrogenase (short-subunit alcohol dehydrogenase family)